MLHAAQLLARYPIISDQVSREDIGVILHEIEQALEHSVAGDIVELGCYIGTTSVFIRRLLDAYNESASRAFHVYDSFAGLPEKTGADQTAAVMGISPGRVHDHMRYVYAHLGLQAANELHITAAPLRAYEETLLTPLDLTPRAVYTP